MSTELFGSGVGVKYTLFELRFGEVVGHLEMTNFDDVLANVPMDVALIEGYYPADEFILAEGVVTALPPRPGPGWMLDPVAVVWIDMRDPDMDQQILRQAASMTRSEFLLAAIRAGIIQPSDAGPAARGEIPPSLAPVFASLPPEVQTEAVVRWGAATMIERANPVLAALAEAMAIPDAQLDALFGI